MCFGPSWNRTDCLSRVLLYSYSYLISSTHGTARKDIYVYSLYTNLNKIATDRVQLNEIKVISASVYEEAATSHIG